MLMLPVQLDHLSREVAQRTRGRQSAADERTAPPLARQLAADDDLLTVVLEYGFDGGVRFTGAHEIGRRAGAEQQPDGLDENGLPCAGFSGQHVEAGFELDFDSLNHRKIADPEKTEHARGTLIVSYI